MRSTCLLALLWPLLSFCQLDSNIQIVIEPGGHRANIKALMFSPDGSKLYSVSDDKTVRVWDLNYDELVNTFRGYSERGNVGMLNSGAISPDGDYIAVAGYLGENQDNAGEIRFYSTYSGDVLSVYRGHQSTVVSLDISQDQSMLASGGSNGHIGVWNLKNGAGTKLTGHNDAVYAAQFSPDGKYLISASYDSTAILWNLEATFNSGKPKLTVLRDHTEELRDAAFSPTGEYFVTVGYDNRILLYDTTGTLLKEIDQLPETEYIGLNDVHSVCFSGDGKAIVIGTSQLEQKNAISYSIPDGTKMVTFQGHDNTVMATACFGDSIVATAGGSTRDIFVWNLYTGEVYNHFVGKGLRNWKVATSADGTIAFSTDRHEYPRVNDYGGLNKVFDLNTLQLLEQEIDDSIYQSENTHKDNFILEMVNRNQLSLLDINIDKHYINLDPGREGYINCYSLTPNNDIAVGSTFGLNVFDSSGKVKRTYRGHHGDVFSVAFTADNRYMVSASADQTICFWDLSDQGKLPKTYDEWISDLKETYGTDKIEAIFEERGEAYMLELYDLQYDPIVNPAATLFVSNDGEWILWTDDLYYAASRLGSQRLGFQQSFHSDTLANFYSFEQFDIQINRPDLVLELFSTGSESLVNSLRMAREKRLQKLNLTESEFSTVDDAPSIEVKTKNQTVTSSYFGLNHVMTDFEYGVQSEFVTINGVPIYGRDGNRVIGGTATAMLINITHVTLTPGMNKIQMWCTNTQGIQSNRETRFIFFDTAEVKPDLYILGIGASEYKDDDYNLSYAAKDIRDFVDFYSKSSKYNNVIIDTLINSEVTNENIANSLQKLDKAKAYDHVIVYIAGHGLLDEDLNYYLATYDMKFKKPEKHGLNYTFLEEEIGTLRSRTRTVFIDACHSGEIDKEEVRADSSGAQIVRNDVRGVVVESTGGMQQDEVFALMRMMFNDLRTNSGATIISSAGGAEYALEGDQWNNGVFTYAVIDGMKSGAADIDQDGEIALEELQKYVALKVEELTHGAQKPTTRVENLQYDYVFWVY
ncbi:hypothetical protein GYB22_07505 [bacterium]|nr:hypothetical protein [bacterium]